MEADGQVTTQRGMGVAVLVADCLPVAVAGAGGVAMLHAGWRGLEAGVIAAGVAALRERGVHGELEAAIGPAAGPCCYEVGDDLRERFPGAARGTQPSTSRRSRPRSCARRASRRFATSASAPSATSATSPIAARATPPAGRRGRMAGLSAERVRENLDRVARRDRARRRGDPGRRRSTCRPTTCRALAQAGVTLVGENRAAGAGGARQRRIPGSPGTSSAICRAARSSSCSRTSAGSTRSPATPSWPSWPSTARPETEVLVEVNVAGEAGKSGDRPRRTGGVHRALPGQGRRPDDDAAAGRQARGQPPLVRRAGASSPPSTGSRSCRWGPLRTLRWPRRRARRSCGSARGCTADCRIGPPAAANLRTWRSATHGTARSCTSAWPRTATRRVEEDPYEPEAALEDHYRERPNVRRLSTKRRRNDFDDIFPDDDDAPARRTAVLKPVAPRQRRGRPRPPGDPQVLQRRPAGGGQVQGLDPRRPEPAGDRHRPVQASHRLRQRAHLRPRRRHAADRRQGVHAHAAQRRDQRGGACGVDREGLLQPV